MQRGGSGEGRSPCPGQSAHPGGSCWCVGTGSTQSSVSRAGPWTPRGLGEHHGSCPHPASSLLVGRVRLPDLCCLSFGLHSQGFSPKIRLSPGKGSAHLLLEGKPRGTGSPVCAFPINFSPVAFAEALTVAMMIMRICLCMAASRAKLQPP